MLTKVQTGRNKASSWLLFFFVLVILISAAITEFFQAPTEKTHVLNQYRQLIEEKKLASTAKIILKNSLGEFTLSRQGAQWRLTSPRDLPANQKTLGLILNTLKNIDIKKVYQSDPINMANFSLDSPLMEFSLINTEGEREDYLLGLVNPIDNTTYIQIPQKDIIYQVEALKNTFESYDLSNFIDSKIFNVEPKEAIALSIYRGEKKQNNVQVSFTMKKGNWVGKSDRVQKSDKVVEYFGKLFNLKSTLIVDKSTEELRKALNEKLEKPLYTIHVTKKNGEKLNYKISHIVHTLPDLKIEKRQHILIKASNRKNVFLIHKDNLPLFAQRQSQYRDLNFKKLFY